MTASAQVARHLNSSFSLYPYLVAELPASRRDVACDVLLEQATVHALKTGLCGQGEEVVVIHGTEAADAEGSPMYTVKVGGCISPGVSVRPHVHGQGRTV